jgi:hypothetical protein
VSSKNEAAMSVPRLRLIIAASLAAMALVDVALCRRFGLGFHDWWRVASVGLAIAGFGLFYWVSGRSREIADLAWWMVTWLIFSFVAAILTYVVAARGGALQDAALAILDARFGFDWAKWFAFVNRHPAVKVAFAAVYSSLMPQILFSVCWFAYRGWDQRNGELLLAVLFGLVATVLCFAAFPALGPCAGVPAFHELYVGDLVGARDGYLDSFEVMQLKGIIAFPSFHAVLAVLFIHAHRGSRGFAPLAALNLLMLVSIPSEGGHYLTDVLVGLIIAALAILVVHALAGWRTAVVAVHPA